MARVAFCPQCNSELLLADDMDASAWAKCPECRAFFQIKDATAREIAQAVFVDDPALAASEETQPAGDTSWTHLDTSRSDSRLTFSDTSAQTISDIESAAATLEHSHDPFGAQNSGLTEPTEATDKASADTYVSSERSPTTVTDVPGMPMSNDALATRSLAAAAEVREENAGAQTTLIQSMPMETVSSETLVPQKLEDSAERIDKWFRSATTQANVPPLETTNFSDLLKTPAAGESAPATAPDTAVSLPAAPALAEEKARIKLEDKPASAAGNATWDDSNRMERSLADVEGKPGRESTAEPQEPPIASSNDQSESANQWSTEISPTLSIGSGGKPRRKKSALRSVATTGIAGAIGIALGYYALFWIAGPSADFLGVAPYLPSAVLPADFQSPASQLAATTPPVNEDAERAEVPASFNEPVAPPSEPSARELDDALPAEADVQTEEPAEFDTAEAAPLTSDLPQGTAAIVSAPTFTADELAVALRAAQEAQPGLVTGDLNDSRDVQRAKGYSYSILCDLAQKATFVDKSSRAEYVEPLESEVDALFRQTLADQHTRDEVAVIVPKWIASPNRKHGGVFFAGAVVSGTNQGSVVECSVDVGGGTSLIVLVPQQHAELLTDPGRPVGFVGWIVERPAGQVTGYTGDAPQAIWASRLISLE